MGFEKLYTAEDVAEITGLTLRTIRNYIKDGRLTGRRIGVQWRFTEADIQALFDSPIPETEGKTAEAAATVTGDMLPKVEDGMDRDTGENETAKNDQRSEPAAEEAEPESEAVQAVNSFVKKKKAARPSSCCIVDMPGMTEQEANFLFTRIRTLADVYEGTPKRLDVVFEYDENRDQARFVFSGSLEAACAVMNLVDVQ